MNEIQMMKFANEMKEIFREGFSDIAKGIKTINKNLNDIERKMPDNAPSKQTDEKKDQ